MKTKTTTIGEILQRSKPEEFKESVKALLQQVREKHWKKEYQSQVTDAAAMGVLMSQYFEWDGLEILKATYEGLEDSNFHKDNETINKLIKRLEAV